MNHRRTTEHDNGAAPQQPRPRFDDVVIPHLEALTRAARSLTGNSHDAEDLVQDTLLRAVRSWDTFDGLHPRAWLMTILRNANVNRHRRRRPSLLTHDDITGDADRWNPPAPSAEEGAGSGLEASALAAVLGRVSPRLRPVVQLVDIDGLTCQEAAAALGLPPGTVMSRLHRARARMRADLLRHHPEFRSHRP